MPEPKTAVPAQKLRVTIEDTCIGAGICEGICPSLFTVGDDGIAVVHQEELMNFSEADLREAEESCPAQAIVVTEDWA